MDPKRGSSAFDVRCTARLARPNGRGRPTGLSSRISLDACVVPPVSTCVNAEPRAVESLLVGALAVALDGCSAGALRSVLKGFLVTVFSERGCLAGFFSLP